MALQDVQLLDRPFGSRSIRGDPTGSRFFDKVRRYPLHNAYQIEDDDCLDFIAVVEKRSPLPVYVQVWDRELAKHEDTLLKNFEERRTATVKLRRLQSAFRDALFQTYSGRCVVSGCQVP